MPITETRWNIWELSTSQKWTKKRNKQKLFHLAFQEHFFEIIFYKIWIDGNKIWKTVKKALLASDVYNMGELLQHEILSSLRGSSSEWLINLLGAFNCGDIETFKSTQAAWNAQPDLKV